MLYIYLVIVNIVAFALMGIDKYKAKNNLWRIPERVLLLAAFIGGSLGAYAGMFYFRHKTKHAKFRILLPLFLVIHLVLLILFFTDAPIATYLRMLY